MVIELQYRGIQQQHTRHVWMPNHLRKHRDLFSSRTIPSNHKLIDRIRVDEQFDDSFVGRRGTAIDRLVFCRGTEARYNLARTTTPGKQGLAN